jgi:hypothetical protein
MYQRELQALNRLLLLRDAWGGGRFIDWLDVSTSYYIKTDLLCFDTVEKAEEFQDTFSDLIEEAKILL